MASPSSGIDGPYGLVKSQSYQDISLPSDRPEYDKLCELLESPPEEKLSSYQLACARIEAFQSSLDEAITDDNLVTAYHIKQLYGKWKDALLHAGETKEENAALAISSAALEAAIEKIS